MPTLTSAPRRRVANPLWIISLFLVLTEVTVGVSATQATGWIAELFAVFSVAFPTVIAVLFFIVIWGRPYVLYAPQDFSKQTSVEAYVSAINSARSGQMKAVETAVRTAISTNIETLADGNLTAEERHAAVNAAVESATHTFAELTIEVNLEAIDEDFRSRSPISLFIDPETTTVGDVLTQIDLAIARYVEPGSYGRIWTLRDQRTGRPFPAGSAQNGGVDPVDETRLLREVDVDPGARLVAVRFRNPRSNVAL